MKIDDVSLTVFSWDDIPPTRYHAGSLRRAGSNLGLLRIHTDEGLEGHAFLGSAGNPASMDGPQQVTALAQADADGPEPAGAGAAASAMLHLSRSVSYRNIGAADVALWDLAGQDRRTSDARADRHLQDSIPAYASSQVLPSVEAYVEQAQSLQGGRLARLQDPSADPAGDRHQGVRGGARGGRRRLHADAGFDAGATTTRTRCASATSIEELDFLWYEDPLADEDIYDYVKLRQKLDIPIMATEFPAGGLDTYPIWITERATDYLRGDIPNKGGLTTMLKTAHLAEAFGMNYEIHHSGNSLNNLANLHLALALRNCEFFEVLLPHEAHKYGMAKELEIDAQRADACADRAWAWAPRSTSS